MKNNHNNNNWLKQLLKEEKEIKRQLSKTILELARMVDRITARQDKNWEEHERWIKQHEVRLGEHWKHISRLK